MRDDGVQTFMPGSRVGEDMGKHQRILTDRNQMINAPLCTPQVTATATVDSSDTSYTRIGTSVSTIFVQRYVTRTSYFIAVSKVHSSRLKTQLHCTSTVLDPDITDMLR